jgi:HSP20 family protein
MGFLDKLKDKIDVEEEKKIKREAAAKKAPKPADFMQLDVDIFQTSAEIIVMAMMAGIDINDLDISLENENDIVTLQGRRQLPIVPEMEEGEYLRQECQWGSFYRQIILPQEVAVDKIEAKINKGILILKLPFLRMQNKGKLKIEIKKD